MYLGDWPFGKPFKKLPTGSLLGVNLRKQLDFMSFQSSTKDIPLTPKTQGQTVPGITCLIMEALFIAHSRMFLQVVDYARYLVPGTWYQVRSDDLWHTLTNTVWNFNAIGWNFWSGLMNCDELWWSFVSGIHTLTNFYKFWYQTYDILQTFWQTFVSALRTLTKLANMFRWNRPPWPDLYQVHLHWRQLEMQCHQRPESFVSLAFRQRFVFLNQSSSKFVKACQDFCQCSSTFIRKLVRVRQRSSLLTLVAGTRCQVPGIHGIPSIPGIPGARYLVPGTGGVLGIPSSLPGTWYLVPGS